MKKVVEYGHKNRKTFFSPNEKNNELSSIQKFKHTKMGHQIIRWSSYLTLHSFSRYIRSI